MATETATASTTKSALATISTITSLQGVHASPPGTTASPNTTHLTVATITPRSTKPSRQLDALKYHGRIQANDGNARATRRASKPSGSTAPSRATAASTCSITPELALSTAPAPPTLTRCAGSTHLTIAADIAGSSDRPGTFCTCSRYAVGTVITNLSCPSNTAPCTCIRLTNTAFTSPTRRRSIDAVFAHILVPSATRSAD